MSDSTGNQPEQNARETQSATTDSIPRKSSIQAMAAKSIEILRKVHDSFSFGKKSSGASFTATMTTPELSKIPSNAKSDAVAEIVTEKATACVKTKAGSDDQTKDSNVNSSPLSEAKQQEATKRGTIRKTKKLGLKIYRDMKKGRGTKEKSQVEQNASQDPAGISTETAKSLPPEAGDLGKKNVGEVQTDKSTTTHKGRELTLQSETASGLPVGATENKNDSQDLKDCLSLHENNRQTNDISEQESSSLPDGTSNESENRSGKIPENNLCAVGDETITQHTSPLSFAISMRASGKVSSEENTMLKAVTIASPANAENILEDEGAKNTAEGTRIQRIQRPRERATHSAKRFIRNIVENIGELSMERAEASRTPSFDSTTTEADIDEGKAVVAGIIKGLF